jgi:hypothetical protein
MKTRFQDRTGNKIGLLTVLYQTNKRKYSKNSIVWMCQCSCGKRKELSVAELRSAKSCGCLRRLSMENFGSRNKGRLPKHALPLGESSIRSAFASCKKSAKQRNYDFLITLDQFKTLIFGKCYYCGSTPKQIWKDRHRTGGSIVRNGIDRRDNDFGYVLENCVPCCKTCNRAKDCMSEQDFLTWIKTVYTNRLTCCVT